MVRTLFLSILLSLSCFSLLAVEKQDNVSKKDLRFTDEIRHYLSTNRSFKALNMVNGFLDTLAKRPSEEGYFACYTAFGEVYMARRDEIHAKESFLNALKQKSALHKNPDLPQVYLNLARITEASDTVSRSHYLHEALKASLTQEDSTCAFMGMAYLYSNSNNVKAFREVYGIYYPMLKRNTNAMTRCDKWYKSNEAFRLQIEQKSDSAYLVRQSIRDPYDRYQAQADYYFAIGDEHHSLVYMDSLVTYLRSAQTSQNISDVAEIDRLYETEKLRMEAKSAEHRMVRNITMIALGFAIIIALLSYFMMRKHRALARTLKGVSDELRKTRDDAVQANKMKDVFIQNMSHEVRTPLNAVMGFAQLLALPAELFSEEERQEFGEHIQNNTNLLTMLIDDILNVSDMESGNYKMVLAQYSVNEICRIALSAIKYRVSETIEVKFETQLPDDYCINTDARRVQQVLINYLTNAIKHTEQGSITLSVEVSEERHLLTLAVADTGTGVPEDKAEEIFERFEKLNAFKQGTGLGLNICRIIASKLNGRVALDTSYPANAEGVEHGARFIFELPI